MSDEQIARALGHIIGKVDQLHDTFVRYVAAHEERHKKIEDKIDDHAAQINQAKGARGVILVLAALVSGAIGWISARIGKLFS